MCGSRERQRGIDRARLVSDCLETKAASEASRPGYQGHTAIELRQMEQSWEELAAAPAAVLAEAMVRRRL